MKPKVTIVIIAPIDPKLKTDQKSFLSAFDQTYDNFDVLIHFEKPVDYGSWGENLYKNCSFNRNIARKLALQGDADYFLFKDWDVVLPKNSISSFILQTGEKKTSMPYINPQTGEKIPAGQIVPEKHIQGGWYPVYYRKTKILATWIPGIYIGDKIFSKFKSPQAGITYTHCVAAGCLFISRKALSELYFEDGLNYAVHDETGMKVTAGECLAFSDCAADKGYEMVMNGDVICEHIKEGRGKWTIYFQSMMQRWQATVFQKATALKSRIIKVVLFQTRKLSSNM